MPGQLRSNAKCPMCGDSLMGIVDTSGSIYITREYHHEKPSPKARRRRFCKRYFTGTVEVSEAKQERHNLETVPIGTIIH